MSINQQCFAPFDPEKIKRQKQKDLQSSLKRNPEMFFNLTPKQTEIMLSEMPTVNQSSYQPKQEKQTQTDRRNDEQDKAFLDGFWDGAIGSDPVNNAVNKMQTFTPVTNDLSEHIVV